MQRNREAYLAGPPISNRRPMTVGALLVDAAKKSPDHKALVTASDDGYKVREASFAGLLAASEQCARRLLELFQPGDRIALWSGNNYEWIVLQFGAAMAGLILVPMNPAFKKEEARHVLTQSKSRACFVSDEFRGAQLAEIVKELEPEIDTLATVVNISQWDDFIGEGEYTGALPDVDPKDPVMIQYTSGTTGLPKGALLVHERLVFDAAQVAERSGVRTNSVWLAPLPLFHAGGCVVSVLGAVSKSATVILMPKWSPDAAVNLIESERVEVMNPVPAMLMDILASHDLDERDLSSWTCAIAGASTVPAHLVQEMQEKLGIEVYIIFGQTECGPVATMTHPSDTPEDKENTVGTPLAGFEIKIVDPESGKTLSRGEIGEFVARGNTMLEYFDNDEANRSAFDDEGWLHTGDLCSIDTRGYVYVEGRIRDMIIRGGENIYPREIEEFMGSLASVKEVAIVGLPHDRMGEMVGAFVVPVSRKVFTRDDVVEAVRSHFAYYKVPEVWVLLDELPRTATGKIQKFVLRENWVSGQYDAISV